MTQVNSALVAAAVQAPTSTADYRVGPDDLLEITLFNVESGTGLIPRTVQVRVSQDGTITLPLLGDIPVAGQTLSTVEQALRQRYNEYLYNPQVGVYIREYRSQQVSVMGAVRNPGVFQLTGPKTLGDLLGMAGGLSAQAASQAHIYRQGSEGRQTYVVDLLALSSNPGLVNMPVQPGDIINVPQTGMFFVHGAVHRQGMHPLLQPLTISQAIAVAGGLNTNLSDDSNVAIFRRRDAAEADRISVDLKAVLVGQAPDPQIEPGDLIIVPTSSAKWFVDRFFGRIGLPGIPAPPIY